MDKELILAGGPFADASGAMFVFQDANMTEEAVEEFVQADPYVFWPPPHPRPSIYHEHR